MQTKFAFPSSDPALLAKATALAESFAARSIRDGILGIAFLGAVARGYFDPFADIDIILYQPADANHSLPGNYLQEQGFEIHCSLANYEDEATSAWDMAKRWAFSTHRIFSDPYGQVSQLFAEKIPLRPEERNWLMIEGMAQSNWYIDTLPRLWAARGNLVSAQHMFDEGLTLFFQALFGLNNELVADVKWRYYCVEQLPILPPHFHERIQDVLRVTSFTEVGVERRRQAFMTMWQDVLPLVEAEVGMPYEEFSLLV